MSDQEQRAKEAVLAVWPDARCVQIVRGKWNIVYGDDPNNIGYANILEPPHLSQSQAWIDAASRLAPTREVEPQQDNRCEGCNEPIYLSRYGYTHTDSTLNVGCDAAADQKRRNNQRIVAQPDMEER